MARVLYTLLYALITPLILLRLLWRSLRSPGYRQRWAERFAYVPTVPNDQAVIWLHAVSVGETLAAVSLIRALQEKWPDKKVLVTSMTPTGSAQVQRIFSDSVLHCYTPYDLPWLVSRFLRRTHPDILVIMETELWPNTIHRCKKQGVPVVIANARLSEKSLAGYQKLSALSGSMVNDISVVASQTERDAGHFMQLGLPESRSAVTGNIKFDLHISDQVKSAASQFREQINKSGERRVLIAASTHQGEEPSILEVFRHLKKEFPELLLILVPRHPERFGEVAKLCEQQGFRYQKRSQGHVPDFQDDVLLGDTMGELMVLLGASDVAFIGGSLVPVGGHNMIEAAAWNLPIVTGSHLFNFQEASRLLVDAGAMTACETQGQLQQTLAQLLADEHTRVETGAIAGRVAAENRGALRRLMTIIDSQLS